MLPVTSSLSGSVETVVIEAIEAMTAEWDWLDQLPVVTLQSRLIADLHFTSVDFVQLFVAIEQRCDRKLGFHDLIMPNDRYVEDLSVAEIVAYIQGRLQPAAAPAPPPTVPAAPTAPAAIAIPPVDAQTVAQFRRLIPTPAPVASGDAKNPPALFILSPPRSGSTLLRVMLAGHSQLFAPPELHLLTYETLQQRQQSLDNAANRHLLTGTLRALKQLGADSDQAAAAQMAAWVAEDRSIQAVYQALQAPLAGRYLVDKTPSYTYHPEILARMERWFDCPLYMHLTRHPYGMIRSFQQAKLDQLVPFLRHSPFTPRQRAELIWVVCHQNILAFLAQIPAARQVWLRYEDLVKTPAETLQTLCQALQLPFEPAMVDPYENPAQRMTDEMQTGTQMSGDLKFYLHGQVDASVADRWRQYHPEAFLGPVARDLAQRFHYED